MLRCKVCKAPLEGFLGNIGKLLFNIKPSAKDSGICNKCIDKPKRAVKDETSKDLNDKLYECQICKRMIHEEHSLEHIKAEEYLINLIRKDHAQWRDKEPTCQECIDYYRELIRKTEI